MPKKKKDDNYIELIYIEWCDAAGKSGWTTLEAAIAWAENDTEWIARNSGWLLKETKEYILISFSYMTGNDYSAESVNDPLKIPKTWIRKRKTLMKIKRRQ